MKLTRTSPLTKQENTMELDITEAEYQQWLRTRGTHKHVLIQRAFPHLSDDEREFILTGYTPEDWNKMFPPEEEENK